ncbi:MAG: hypothetical protein COU27_00755, partial [Candidatus Levybacteria bacterium CG10_big_fil_rev_8_21_14_0_10_36_7]
MKQESLLRIRIIFIAIVVLAFLLMVRLFFVQIVHGEEFKEKADNQYITTSSNLFLRGSIFFQEKSGHLVSAATLQSGYIVAIKPGLIKDPQETFRAINEKIPINEEEFFEKVSKINDPYEEIARRVSEEDGKTIRDLDIDGVSIYKEQWRYYPGENKASHILGFVGFQGDVQTGRYGVERYYNDILSRNNSALYVNFFAELFSNITDSILKGENPREGNIILTLEPHVQAYVEN